MSYVEFKDVKKVYKTGEVEINALRDVDFEIEKGEFCVIVGASGARIRMFIYSILGHKLKGNVFPDCFLGVSKGRLFLGQGSFINYSCFLDLSDDIVIGKNVAVGFKTTFINATHEMGSSEQRAGNGTSQPIRIEDGCWIGAGVTIMPV